MSYLHSDACKCPVGLGIVVIACRLRLISKLYVASARDSTCDDDYIN
jgi:hypothetical protein